MHYICHVPYLGGNINSLQNARRNVIIKFPHDYAVLKFDPTRGVKDGKITFY